MGRVVIKIRCVDYEIDGISIGCVHTFLIKGYIAVMKTVINKRFVNVAHIKIQTQLNPHQPIFCANSKILIK